METQKREKQAKYLETIGLMFRGVIAKAFDGTGSPRQAIKAKCLTCANLDREEITECRVFTCPLHAFRPYQAGAAKPA